MEKLETFYQHSLFLNQGDSKGWPWVAGSGVIGLKKVTVAGMKPGTYQIRITTTTDKSRLSYTTDDTKTAEVKDDGILTIDTATPSATVCGIEIIRSEAK